MATKNLSVQRKQITKKQVIGWVLTLITLVAFLPVVWIVIGTKRHCYGNNGFVRDDLTAIRA